MNNIEQELEKMYYFIDHCPNVSEGSCMMFLEDKKIKVTQNNGYFSIKCNELEYDRLSKSEVKDMCEKITYNEDLGISILDLLYNGKKHVHTNSFGTITFRINSDIIDNGTISGRDETTLLLNEYVLCQDERDIQMNKLIDEYIKLFDENRLVFVEGGIVVVNRDDNGSITDIVRCVGEN